jgi:hypothetical protein
MSWKPGCSSGQRAEASAESVRALTCKGGEPYPGQSPPARPIARFPREKRSGTPTRGFPSKILRKRLGEHFVDQVSVDHHPVTNLLNGSIRSHRADGCDDAEAQEGDVGDLDGCGKRRG